VRGNTNVLLEQFGSLVSRNAGLRRRGQG
jgi:hypothetical protein